MPRAIWSGAISFGLVNIPIKLYNAVSRKSVSFHQIDARTEARVKMKRVSADDDSEVPYEQIVKGYELSPGNYVVIDPAELDTLDPEATRSVDIEEFVDLADIDPVFFDTPYYVAPVKGAEKPYALLARALEEQGKVAVARFVMRTKQYLAAVRAKDGTLVLSTMVYADEVAPANSVSELSSLDDVTVSDRELGMAQQLIESLSAPFEPERYRDTYRDRVLELIEAKAAGQEIIETAPAATDEGKVVDLMAALEASVAEAREARKRHPTGADEEAGADDDEDGASGNGTAAVAKEKPAKKATATTKAAKAKKKAQPSRQSA
ncbi:MAG: Ku protein [Actinomycetota bacterium]|nr:Ku protein [Acidimicrobiia bacterium]MDQ3147135.1 Ku protein [Actinomycetota bacterium]